jgi:hypothetical protein
LLLGRDIERNGQRNNEQREKQSTHGVPPLNSSACKKLINHALSRIAEQRDELAPRHSITSSARASRIGGTSRPSL